MQWNFEKLNWDEKLLTSQKAGSLIRKNFIFKDFLNLIFQEKRRKSEQSMCTEFQFRFLVNCIDSGWVDR